MSICIKVDIKATQLPNFLEHQQMQSFSYNNMLNVTESTQTHNFLGEIYIYAPCIQLIKGICIGNLSVCPRD